MTFKIGDTARVHPASDWFMRGVAVVRVRKVGTKWVHVTATVGRGIGTNFKISPSLLEHV